MISIENIWLEKTEQCTCVKEMMFKCPNCTSNMEVQGGDFQRSIILIDIKCPDCKTEMSVLIRIRA